MLQYVLHHVICKYMIVYWLTMPEKNLLYKCDVWFIERCFTQLVDGHIRCFKHMRDGFIDNNF